MSKPTPQALDVDKIENDAQLFLAIATFVVAGIALWRKLSPPAPKS